MGMNRHARCVRLAARIQRRRRRRRDENPSRVTGRRLETARAAADRKEEKERANDWGFLGGARRDGGRTDERAWGESQLCRLCLALQPGQKRQSLLKSVIRTSRAARKSDWQSAAAAR